MYSAHSKWTVKAHDRVPCDPFFAVMILLSIPLWLYITSANWSHFEFTNRQSYYSGINAWIGVKYVRSTSSSVYPDGSPIGFVNWNSDEPTAQGCATFRAEDGKWAVTTCTAKNNFTCVSTPRENDALTNHALCHHDAWMQPWRVTRQGCISNSPGLHWCIMMTKCHLLATCRL